MEQQITLTVSIQEAEIIFEALSEMPLKVVGPFFDRLAQEATQQATSPESPTESNDD